MITNSFPSTERIPIERRNRVISLIAVALAFVVFLAYLGPASAKAEFGFLANWGEQGTGNGELNNAQDVAVDSTGNIYVADGGNFRIQKLDSNGSFIEKWGSVFDNPMVMPLSAVFDSQDKIYVAEKYYDIREDGALEPVNYRIRKLDSSGGVIENWGDVGSGDGQFNIPWGIAVDQVGNVYVADGYNHRIQKFNSSGDFLAKWGEFGSGDGQFKYPHGVSTDSRGNVYVADAGNHRIQKFNSNGTFLAEWGSKGTGNGKFNNPLDIAIDLNGNVYIADSGNHRIQKFDSNGGFISVWGSYCNLSSNQDNPEVCDGLFNAPQGVGVDLYGNVYTTEGQNHRIQKFGEFPEDSAPGQDPETIKSPIPPPPAQPSSQPSSGAEQPGQLGSGGYGQACKLKITSPKAETGKSRSVKLSSKSARRLFTQGLKGYIAWGKVDGKEVVCKKVRIALLEKRGKRYYVPGTKIRVSGRRLKPESFVKKTVGFLRKKRVGMLRQKQISSKRRTNISFNEFSRGSGLGKRALRKLKRRGYRGTYVAVFSARVNGETVKSTVVIKVKKR